MMALFETSRWNQFIPRKNVTPQKLNMKPENVFPRGKGKSSSKLFFCSMLSFGGCRPHQLLPLGFCVHSFGFHTPGVRESVLGNVADWELVALHTGVAMATYFLLSPSLPVIPPEVFAVFFFCMFLGSKYLLTRCLEAYREGDGGTFSENWQKMENPQFFMGDTSSNGRFGFIPM